MNYFYMRKDNYADYRTGRGKTRWMLFRHGPSHDSQSWLLANPNSRPLNPNSRPLTIRHNRALILRTQTKAQVPICMTHERNSRTSQIVAIVHGFSVMHTYTLLDPTRSNRGVRSSGAQYASQCRSTHMLFIVLS